MIASFLKAISRAGLRSWSRSRRIAAPESWRSSGKTDGRGFVLRVLVDKAGSAEKRAQTQESAVDLEVCANISRALLAVLDTASPDPVPGHYSLEVGSPGR